MSNLITTTVLSKIKDGIESHARANGLTKFDLYVKIFPTDEDLNPGFVLCNHTKPIADISFGDFIGITTFMGFDVAGNGWQWTKKFLIMSANDNDIDFYDNHYYFIRIEPKSQALQAYMYRDDMPLKEITIDYILQTK